MAGQHAQRVIDDAERRARLAVRHRVAPAHRATDVVEATAAMTCLHATESANAYLSLAARCDATRDEVDTALYRDRSLVRQLAMRRTLFIFERDLLPAVWGSASARVARQQRARLAKDVVQGGIATDGPAWVAATTAEVLKTLSAHGPLTTAELRERIPPMAQTLDNAPGTSYGTTTPVAPRVLATLAADGSVLRGVNEGGWKTSRPRWTVAAEWLGASPAPLPEDDGYAVLVARWLRTFGPGTTGDLAWWLGATKGAVAAALVTIEAVPVTLEDGAPAWVAADDVEPVLEPEPWVALLPVLDPTTMGWKERGFYLSTHAPRLFDRNGNGGATAWWCGRVVGGWHQTPDGRVEVDLLVDVGVEAEQALAVEAERLSVWLDGDVVRSVYASPLARERMAVPG